MAKRTTHSPGAGKSASSRGFNYQLRLPASLDAEIEEWQKSQLFETPKSAILLKAVELGLPRLKEEADRLAQQRKANQDG